MSLDALQSKLKELEKLSNQDYYLKFYADGSSSIHSLQDDDFFIHNFTNADLKQNLNKLILRYK